MKQAHACGTTESCSSGWGPAPGTHQEFDCRQRPPLSSWLTVAATLFFSATLSTRMCQNAGCTAGLVAPGQPVDVNGAVLYRQHCNARLARGVVAVTVAFEEASVCGMQAHCSAATRLGVPAPALPPLESKRPPVPLPAASGG